MKTRHGFVSNSSSASFIVHTNWNESELRDICQTHFKDMFNEAYLKNAIKNRIKDVEHMQKWWAKNKKRKDEDETSKSKEYWQKYYVKEKKESAQKLVDLKALLVKVDTMTEDEVMDEIIGLQQLKLEENDLGKAGFSGWTAMWNDHHDMGEFLVELKGKIEKKFGAKSTMTTIESDY